MHAVYLLTLVCGLSWTLSMTAYGQKIPTWTELSAHQAGLIKVSRITKSLFNKCKEAPELLEAGTTFGGTAVLSVVHPGSMALSLLSSLLL